VIDEWRMQKRALARELEKKKKKKKKKKRKKVGSNMQREES